MDYEKKYKNALTIAQSRFKIEKDESVLTCLGMMFPELRENEDERIRKALIDALKVSETIGELKFRLPYPTREECIAYLEKQKEQKQEWSEEDEENINSICSYLDSYCRYHEKDGYGVEECKIRKDWLKFLPERFNLQPKEEWSEEDEDMLNSCISSIEEAKENRYAYKETDGDTSYDHEIAWLKSIRPSWKPSEEQMLKDAVEERVQRTPLNGPLGISAYCCNFPSNHPFYHCKEGDKVRVIIVKED